MTPAASTPDTDVCFLTARLVQSNFDPADPRYAVAGEIAALIAAQFPVSADAKAKSNKLLGLA